MLFRSCQTLGRREMMLASDCLAQLARYPWPGNVRELRNLMDYAAATVAGDVLEPHHLPERVRRGDSPPGPVAEPDAPLPPPAPPPSPVAGEPSFRPLSEEIRELERRRMEEALQAADGVQTRAATLIGMPIRTFSFKLKQFGLTARGAKRATPSS